MKRMMMIAAFALAAGIAISAVHRVNPRIDTNHKTPIMRGDEALPPGTMIAQSQYDDGALDTVGMVLRAGRTWYDCQGNGTLGRMIGTDTAGNVHVVWMRGVDSGAVSRQVYYNMFNLRTRAWAFGANGSQVPPQVISRSGFVSMGMYQGIPFPSFHENNPRITGSATSSNTYHDIEAGVGAFIADQPMSTVTVAGAHMQAIWPRVAIGRNGRVHVITNESTAAAADPQRQWYHRGVYDAVNTTVTWSPAVELPGTTENIAAEVAASRVTNKAAVAWMRPMGLDQTPPLTSNNQVSNNVVLVESQDGDTWNFSNMTYVTNWRNPNAALLPDTAAANGDTFRAYNDISMLYDRNDALHVAFTTGLFYRWDVHQNDSTGATIPSDSSYYVWGHIWHWRQEAEWGRISMIANGGNYWSDIYANPGAWNRTVHRPSLAEAANGDLYCVFAGSYDPRDTTMAQDVSLAGECNFDVFVTVSTDGGTRWAYPTNVTHTRTPEAAAGACRSEHWPTTAQVVDSLIHITYVTDYDAGWIFQSEGAWTNNDFNYHGVYANAIPTSPLIPWNGVVFSAPEPIAEQSIPGDFRIESNYPNPFNPTTEIVFSLGQAQNVKLAVYDIQGREVALLSETRMGAGKYRVAFNATGLPSGVYFARMTAGNRSDVRKLTLLK